MADEQNDPSEMVDGAMLVIADRAYFIPRDELRSYRVPDDVAVAVHDTLSDEVAGFSASPGQAQVFGVQFDMRFDPNPKPGAFGPKEPLKMSSIMAHAMTVITC